MIPSRSNVPTSVALLMPLLNRLQTFRVDWKVVAGKAGFAQDQPDYEPGIDREEADLEKSNVVSSIIKPEPNFSPISSDGRGGHARHVVAIDLDIPAHLVPSSTPGHSHLYIEVKGGIPHHRYMALLSALADAGVIERGYADVSIARGHSDLRLPWVRKGQELPAVEMAPLPVEPVQVAAVTPPFDREAPPVPTTPTGEYHF